MRTYILAAVTAFAMSEMARAQELEINHIRVGQGDATLLLGPEQSDGSRVLVLIDAGMPNAGYNGGRIILAVLCKYGLRSLHYFVATHYDADYIGGSWSAVPLFTATDSCLAGTTHPARPEIPIISVGNDIPQHHPNEHALARVVAAGVYRIYSWGTTRGVMQDEVRRHRAIFQQDIIVKTHGQSYSIFTSSTFRVNE